MEASLRQSSLVLQVGHRSSTLNHSEQSEPGLQPQAETIWLLVQILISLYIHELPISYDEITAGREVEGVLNYWVQPISVAKYYTSCK